MHIEILQLTDPKVIEIATCCSRNTDHIDNLPKKVFEWQHWGLLEHALISLHIMDISRACCDQLTRYRIGHSFVVQSQRHVDPTLGKDWCIDPYEFILDDEALCTEFHDIAERTKGFYHNLLKRGIPNEDARFILPMGTKTQVVWTTTMRGLFHFFSQRLNEHAQWEIRALATELLTKLADSAWKEYIDAFQQFSAKAQSL